MTKRSIQSKKKKKKVSGVIITQVYCTAKIPPYIVMFIFSLFP